MSVYMQGYFMVYVTNWNFNVINVATHFISLMSIQIFFFYWAVVIGVFSVTADADSQKTSEMEYKYIIFSQ